MSSAQSGNKALAVRLSEWSFGEVGRLRVRNVHHNRKGEKESSNTYTITDTVVSINRVSVLTKLYILPQSSFQELKIHMSKVTKILE